VTKRYGKSPRLRAAKVTAAGAVGGAATSLAADAVVAGLRARRLRVRSGRMRAFRRIYGRMARPNAVGWGVIGGGLAAAPYVISRLRKKKRR
jgi:hypothetical protein